MLGPGVICPFSGFPPDRSWTILGIASSETHCPTAGGVDPGEGSSGGRKGKGRCKMQMMEIGLMTPAKDPSVGLYVELLRHGGSCSHPTGVPTVPHSVSLLVVTLPTTRHSVGDPVPLIS